LAQGQYKDVEIADGVAALLPVQVSIWKVERIDGA